MNYKIIRELERQNIEYNKDNEGRTVTFDLNDMTVKVHEIRAEWYEYHLETDNGAFHRYESSDKVIAWIRCRCV